MTATSRTTPAICFGRRIKLRESRRLASLGAVGLTARAAHKMGRSTKWVAVFVGLNPVLLELAVGGAHNDTLVLLVMEA